MTSLPIVLGALAVIGAGLALTFLRVARVRRRSSAAVLGREMVRTGRSPLETYAPMGRLLAREDWEFVNGPARLPLSVRRHFRRQRRKILSLYLRDLRADFGRVYALCRELAPYSPDPGFAAEVTRQALLFHAQWLAVELRAALGWSWTTPTRASELVAAFDRLYHAARVTGEAFEARPVYAFSRA